MSAPTANKPADVAEAPLTIALIGNPNTGKSTLFNALGGMNARIGNFPGVTVEKKTSRVRWNDCAVELVDLPGAYSLSPRSPDEMVTIDVLLGRRDDVAPVDAVLCVVDASNLERNLYLASQLLSLGIPLVLVLNMRDIARQRGLRIDTARLSERLGAPIVETEGHRRRGLDELRAAVLRAVRSPAAAAPTIFDASFYDARDKVAALLPPNLPASLAERLLIDVNGQLQRELLPEAAAPQLEKIRAELAEQGCRLPAAEAAARYRWIRQQLDGVFHRPATRPTTASDKIDRLLTHRVAGLAIFAAVMFLVFQAIYRGAEPLMNAVADGQQAVSAAVQSQMAPGPLRSLLTDGVIAGVGAVVTFLPQILVLFLFIALLEDCGYMARAAFLMDKLMTRMGLSGKSFVPLMSSFACAIPGVMATRVIENKRDRMVTILIAPLMSCSARLPVYVLLIQAFIPERQLGGWVSLRGLTLLAMSSLGLAVAIPVAWLLKRFVFPGEPSPLVMELPDYKVPTPRIVLHRALDRGRAFVTRAGTLIFATAIVVWAAGYFPGDHREQQALESQLESLERTADAAARQLARVDKQLARAGEASPEQIPPLRAERAALQETIDEAERQIAPMLEPQRSYSAALIRDSYLGRLGRTIEPIVEPLGWDWKIGVGAIASFPAREVIIATLGTIYSLGGEVDEQDEGLQGALRAATWPDGRPVYGVPVALSIMVFFALCAQCGATLMVIKRETNSWKWPLFTFTYMTALAYVGALLTYQIASRILG